MNPSPLHKLVTLTLVTSSTVYAADVRPSSGSAMTTGAIRTLPMSAIQSVRRLLAGGSVTIVQDDCDRSWYGIGSDGNGMLSRLPTILSYESLEDKNAIALGNAHGIAMKTASELVMWGDADAYTNPDGSTMPSTPPAGSLTWSGVAAGGSHSAAWSTDGGVVLAGRDDFGQCSGAAAQQPPGGWERIALGASHSLGSANSGGVRAWGLSASGQTSVPADSRLLDTRALAAGMMHSVAVTGDGALIGWGSNASRQLEFNSQTPPTGEHWIDVKAGALHTVALRQDGLARAWGANTYRQCAIGPNGESERFGVDLIAAGLYHSVVASQDGVCPTQSAIMTSAGANFFGETGVPTDKLIDIANGDGFFVGLRDDRTLVAWGSRSDRIQDDVPTGVWASCAAGSRHAAAISSSGTLTMWGDNSDKQAMPPTPRDGEAWVRVALGTKHTVGLLSTGRVTAWGSNAAQQTGVPTGLTASAITAGAFFSGAVRPSGEPVIWGSNPDGALTPASNTRLTGIAAGAEHCIGITQSKSLVAWGSNQRGQCNIPTLESAPLQVAASGSISACLLTDGRVAVWGSMRKLDGEYAPVPPLPLPPQTVDKKPLRAHRLSVGGETVSALVGHEYIADFNLGPYFTIQDAIDAAPIGAVVRVAPGRWYPSRIRTDMTGLVLRGDITLTAEHPDQTGSEILGTKLYGSASVTNDPRFDNTALSSSIITCWNNESPECVIRGFTFYGGAKGRVWPTNPASVVGGAIYIGNRLTAEFCESTLISGASPTIDRCRFINGFAGYGGGIFINRSRSNISNCEFINNTAQTVGGAIYAYAHNGVISDCKFTNNVAVNSDGGGIAIITTGDAFSWCNSNCQTRVGCESVTADCTRRFDIGAPRIERCTFTGNLSNAFGGAISYSIGFRHPEATGADGLPLRQVRLIDCMITGNSAPQGGGGIAIGLEKWRSDPRTDCPYPDNTGIELTGTKVLGNSSVASGAYRFRDIMGPLVDLGDNTLNDEGIGSPCPADIDGSGAVDYGDLAVVVLLIGTWNTGDLDDNGIVDYGDVVYLLLEFGPCR